jgi:hypothetical protein
MEEKYYNQTVCNSKSMNKKEGAMKVFKDQGKNANRLPRLSIRSHCGYKSQPAPLIL